jgi:hypothetical protein
MMNRLDALAVAAATTSAARALIAGLILVELAPVAPARAIEPWPVPGRSLVVPHLAACDQRMAAAARGPTRSRRCGKP